MISLDCRDIICFTSEKRKNIVIAESGEFEYYGKFSDIMDKLPRQNFAELRNNFIALVLRSKVLTDFAKSLLPTKNVCLKPFGLPNVPNAIKLMLFAINL